MIVPMKKAVLIVQTKDADSCVRSLRSLGVLHIEHQEAPVGTSVASLKTDISALETAIGILGSKDLVSKKDPGVLARPLDPLLLARRVIELHRRLDQLEEFSRTLTRKISEWKQWGDFDPGKVRLLEQKGVFLRLYQVPLREIKSFPSGVIVKVVSVSAGVTCCAVISRSKIVIAFPEVSLPNMGLGDMQRRLAQDSKIMDELRGSLGEAALYLKEVTGFKGSLEKEMEFQEVISGMGKAGVFTYIKGYVPHDSVQRLTVKSREERWGLLITEPSEEDIVPTLLRNPRAISLIAPLFKLLELLPGYREMDISPLFLIFLSLFFGMIIGDAGYGMLYILLIFLLQKKFENKMLDKKIWYLLYLFSSCAVFWGLLTATVFGAQWCQAAGLKPLAPLLNNTKFLQAFCFFVGATHLTLGHLWQALRKAPSLSALSDIGWACILWTAYFAARLLILNDPFPHFAIWLGVAGLSLVLLFTNPQRNIIKAIGYGLGAIALGLVNNFTDVVSYVRLFAVGLAGVAIADTVNTLAAGLGSGIARLIVLCIGHAVNLVLGLLSVLVHGVRLNVLEFSGHAGISWSGAEYKPLKE